MKGWINLPEGVGVAGKSEGPIVSSLFRRVQVCTWRRGNPFMSALASWEILSEEKDFPVFNFFNFCNLHLFSGLIRSQATVPRASCLLLSVHPEGMRHAATFSQTQDFFLWKKSPTFCTDEAQNIENQKGWGKCITPPHTLSYYYYWWLVFQKSSIHFTYFYNKTSMLPCNVISSLHLTLFEKYLFHLQITMSNTVLLFQQYSIVGYVLIY